MGFWSGLTGHQPGAFKGFSLKDIIDDDLWKRKQRTWSGQMEPTGPGDLRFSRGGEPMMTNWYKGRGAGGGAGAGAGGGAADQPRPPAFSSPMRPEGALAGPSQYPQVSALPESNITSRPIPTNPYKRDWRPGMSQIGGNTVPTMYHPYMFGQRPDQMGAAQWNPLNRRIQQSRRDQQGLTTAGQYRKGIQDAVGTLGDAFLPKNVMTHGREMWGDMKDFYYPEVDKTIVKKIVDDPNVPNTITETIKQKGPANPTNTLMNMGAFKDTANDFWQTWSKPNFLSDPEFWRKFRLNPGTRLY